MSEKLGVRICPSVLAADFAHLADEVCRAEEAGADALHVDIMDGHFVPNLSMGPSIVAAINRSTDLPLHVHLMMYNPFEYIDRFVEVGADQIIFHFEATEDVEDTLHFIKKCSVQAGIAINPETPADLLRKYFPLLDEILIMSVHPGFGGQGFIPETIQKIKETAFYIREHGGAKRRSPLRIAVDGGINEQTVIECAQSGATVFAAGTHFFQSPDMKGAITSMREQVETACF